MQKDLSNFINSGKYLCDESVSWGDDIRLQITGYLCNKSAPPEYVSSVRAIVFRNRSVLVLKEPDGRMSILPGGRVEKGEAILETLRREILEETGWNVSVIRLLGFMHLHHLGPKPDGYTYLYPDFLWLIYLVEANEFQANAKIYDEYVSDSEFRSIEEVERLPIDKGQLLFLESVRRKR